MKRASLTKALLLLCPIGLSIYLCTLSGCVYDETQCGTPIIFGEIVNGNSPVNISGPEILSSCESSKEYHAQVNGQDIDFSTINDPTKQSLIEWVVTGDLEIVSDRFSNPVEVKGNVIDGVGNLALQVTDCTNVSSVPAAKDIDVSPFLINSTVCIDVSNTGSGVLTLVDPTNLPLQGVDDCIWEANPAEATLVAQADKTSCQVTDVKSSFIVNVLVKKGKCSSVVKAFFIDVPKCKL